MVLHHQVTFEVVSLNNQTQIYYSLSLIDL